VRNCMIDSGAAMNIMPITVMKELGMWVDTTFGRCYAMDNRSIPFIGIMRDVEIQLASYPEATYNIDITMVDIPPYYGMLLSRQWAMMAGGNVQLDLSYATILVGGKEIKLYRETRYENIIECLDQHQINLFCDTDLGAFKVEKN